MKALKLTASLPLNKKVSVKELDGELESLQAEVQGTIDFFEISYGGKNFDIILNDEGKMIGLEPNIAIIHEGEIVDLIMGDVLIMKVDEEGATMGLSDEEISVLSEYFSSKGIFTSYGLLSAYAMQ